MKKKPVKDQTSILYLALVEVLNTNEKKWHAKAKERMDRHAAFIEATKRVRVPSFVIEKEVELIDKAWQQVMLARRQREALHLVLPMLADAGIGLYEDKS